MEAPREHIRAITPLDFTKVTAVGNLHETLKNTLKTKTYRGKLASELLDQVEYIRRGFGDEKMFQSHAYSYWAIEALNFIYDHKKTPAVGTTANKWLKWNGDLNFTKHRIDSIIKQLGVTDSTSNNQAAFFVEKDKKHSLRTLLRNYDYFKYTEKEHGKSVFLIADYIQENFEDQVATIARTDAKYYRGVAEEILKNINPLREQQLIVLTGLFSLKGDEKRIGGIGLKILNNQKPWLLAQAKIFLSHPPYNFKIMENGIEKSETDLQAGLRDIFKDFDLALKDVEGEDKKETPHSEFLRVGALVVAASVKELVDLTEEPTENSSPSI